jgi:transketolase
MRKEFATLLLNEMNQNNKIILLTADIGYGILDTIRSKYPERVINIGASENLMIGIAIGYYYEGYIPICYTISPFLIYRPFEMIRNYINYENIPIKLIGAGRDKDYIHDGITHWADDDSIIIGSSFPNIKINKPEISDLTDIYIHNILYSNHPEYLNIRRN